MFFHPMDWLIIVMVFVSMWAQFKVKGNFDKWSGVDASCGLTGAEVARKILDDHSLYDVPVEMVPGTLSDHYDPISRTVRLSEPVYYGKSIASLSVAAHECGHSIQDLENYGALVLRHRMFPLVNFSSGLAPLFLLAGFFFNATSMIGLGILFFSGAVAFQCVTLPVEFNASNRARDILINSGFIRNEEEKGVKKVLGAAALTYVAAALMAVMELIKYVLIFRSNED